MALSSQLEPQDSRPHVVIVGGGFAGLLCARGLAGAKVRVTLIDRRNHHLFQPLLYQVATGSLSPANIAAPLRALLASQKNTRVFLREVTGIDLEGRKVLCAERDDLGYDYLVVATGAGQSYFGHDDWQRYAPGLKTLDDATRIRRKILLAYERAEQTDDPQDIAALTTFVVVGAGPTGVELAGALAEMAVGTLKGEFRHIHTETSRVLLVEGMDRVLPPFSEKQSANAQRDLERLGVEVRTGTMVKEIGDGVLELAPTGDKEAEPERLHAATVLWAAGVAASPLGKALGEQSDAQTTRPGKVKVLPDCSLAGRPEVFVCGDLASFEQDGSELPGLAPVAMQQGRYVAERIARLAKDASSPAKKGFRYVDKGTMAVIGRRLAVADIRGLEFRGAIAWLMWLFIHLMYLAEFQNRVLVLIQWGWNYVTRNRSARLITEEPGSQPDPPGETPARG